MPSRAFHRIKQLFDSLVELPEAERDAFLALQPELGEDARRQLRDLLRADGAAGPLTARSAVRDTAREQARGQPLLGLRIGAFEIRRELGQGGMGSVYLAERVDGEVEQQVAIKVIRPEVLDASTLARFRLERQLLALLQHPDIPTMLDLGELDDGSPYAIMEYVAGDPIDRYAVAHKLGLEPRLRLLLQVCEVVAYAHRNMIVHRDLKPGNVLVDTDGHPKLLDFGIAKPLLGQVGAIDVEQTVAAQRFVSLSHAAPEQLRGGVIGAACDVYGLGVLLYELLAGAPPFVLGQRTPAQLESEICDVDPPPPSRRADSAARGAAFAVPRDLDLIALRCLRKRPEDRYASVDQLAGDLRRFLGGQPVLARRGNLLYRAGRFVARHRVAVTLSLLLLGGGLLGTVLLWRQHLATAEQQLRADEMSNLIMDALRSADPRGSSTKDLTARDVFERVAAQAQASPQLSPRSRARVLMAIARIDVELGQYRQAEALLDQVDVTTLDSIQRSEWDLLQARAQLYLAHYDRARELLAQPLAATADADLAARWRLAQAFSHYEAGDTRKTLEILDTMDIAGTLPDTREERGELRSWALVQLGRTDDAIAEQVALLAVQRERLGERSPAVYDSLTNLAYLQLRNGAIDQAEATMQDLFVLADAMYSKTSLRYAPALSLARKLARERGNLAKAIALEKQVIAINLDQIGENSPHLARNYFNLADLYDRDRQPDQAEAYFRHALALAERVWLPSDTNVALFRISAACFLAERGKHAEAQAIARRALADIEAHPSIKEYDIYPLGLAVEALSSYALGHGEKQRGALAAALKEIRDGAADVDTVAWAQRLIAVAAGLGVEPAA